jgi:hypothetical protein
MITPNMSLELPEPLGTSGPEWAVQLTAALAIIDAHDHSAGNGAPIGVNVPIDSLTVNSIAVSGGQVTIINEYGTNGTISAPFTETLMQIAAEHYLWLIAPSGTILLSGSTGVTSTSNFVANAGFTASFATVGALSALQIRSFYNYYPPALIDFTQWDTIKLTASSIVVIGDLTASSLLITGTAGTITTSKSHRLALTQDATENSDPRIRVVGKSGLYSELSTNDSEPYGETKLLLGNFSIRNDVSGTDVLVQTVSDKRFVIVGNAGLGAGTGKLFVDGTGTFKTITVSGLAAFSGTTTGLPWEVNFFKSGTYIASERVFSYVFPRSVSWLSGASGAYARASTGSAGGVNFAILKNGASFGSCSFPTSNTGSFANTPVQTFVAGDQLTLIAPSAADATLASVSITFVGTRLT